MADLYEVLGVEPNASPGEIRRAYNSRVLITHPDHNRDNTYAEKWTQQLNAAYDVLKDPEKRAAYDLENGIGPSSRRHRSNHDPGQSDDRHDENYRRNNRRDVLAIEIHISLERVENGYRDQWQNDAGPIAIDIPPGVEDGEHIRINPLGDDDLDLVIRVEPHDRFTRRGADLYTELSVRKADALNREIVGVPTLGSWVDFDLKPEVLQEESIRLRGHGLPFRHNPRRRGNLHVTFKILPIPDRPVDVTLAEVDRGCLPRFQDFGEVKIPPGVATGTRIYVWNKYGKEANLLVNVIPHPVFTRVRDDLHTTVRVNYASMLLQLGHRLQITDYRALSVRLRPEYANGQQVRLAGQGLPNYRNPQKRGDLYVTFSTTRWEPPLPAPASRWGRLVNFFRKSMVNTFKAIGIANVAVQKTITAYRTLRAAVGRNWYWIRTTLIALGILGGLTLIGWLVYFIIVNIVIILIATAVVGVSVGLFLAWMRALAN